MKNNLIILATLFVTLLACSEESQLEEFTTTKKEIKKSFKKAVDGFQEDICSAEDAECVARKKDQFLIEK